MPPPKKILFYYPLVFPSVKLQYKSAPLVRFFSAPLISSLLLLQIIGISLCIFVVLIVVFNILKGMILLSLHFFYFFYFNYDYFCGVLCFVYCL